MFESITEFVISVIVIVAAGVGCVFIGKALGLRPVYVAVLYVWHSLLGVYYANLVLQNGGDAFVYYQKAKFDFIQLDLGTEFVVWLTSFLTGAGLAYWPISLLYNAVGAVGLAFYCAALRETGVLSDRSWFVRLVAVLCLLTPSLSFWTSGIGKDSIAFLSVGMFIWSTMSFGRRQPAAIASVLIMLAIRPHMAVLMVLSIAAGTVLVTELRGSIRFGVAALATVGAVFAVPLALVYSGTTQFTSIGDYISDRQEQNLGGGSSIDISAMNPVLRLLSFLYRPLPNEASGLDQFAASLDNLFLILLTVIGLVGMYRAGFIRTFRSYGIALIYAMLCLILLSQVTANLGIATRQKWMLAPAFIVASLAAWSMARAALAEKQVARRYRPGSAQGLR